ncbi:cytochrome P450 [Streptomyces sp. CRN 30]|uniref:cytochrome P450 n=1 Tax=Streptomyces sp. CRN 30 TaxID=3075613 RepID=UPI002A8198E2|nr:cytochrome P450 [Streptomyces sp. CRN 30]
MQRQQEPLAYPFEPGAGLELDPRYAELRERPLARVRMPYGEEAWLATRYADVRAVLSDPRFSLAASLGRDYPRLEPVAAANHGGLMSLDPPGHTRLRSVLSREFTARRIERLRARARQVADEVLDRLVESGSPADLVEQFAVPFPTALHCELLGVPRGYGRFWDWVEANLFDLRADGDAGDGGDGGEEFVGEFTARIAGLVELRRAEPAGDGDDDGDDLIGVLLRARDEDGRITEDELLAVVGDLLVAGFSTVAGQIAVSLHHLVIRPEQLARLGERPELIPGAARELLRYVQLIDFTTARYAVEDIQLGGVLVRAGEPVLAALAAADRDAAAFPGADDLVLDRAGPPPLAFGHGTHHCLGAHLARLDLEVALETALRRLPGLRLAVQEDELRWKTSGIVNGLHELPVVFGSEGDRTADTADTAGA